MPATLQMRVMRHLRAAGFAAVCLASAAPSIGQETKQAAKWQIDWGEQRCTLLRQVEGGARMTMALRLIPGRPVPEFSLVNAGWNSDPLGLTETVELILMPANTRIEARAVSVKLGDGAGRAVMMDSLPLEFIDQFAATNQIVVKARGKTLAEISFTGAAKAVDALVQCNDGLLTAWGVDPTELRSLRSLPTADEAGLFNARDYPVGSIRAGSSGTVVVVFTVGTDGQVSDCKAVGPSGDENLDSRTCAIFTERGRFTPAIGQDGAPKSVKLVRTVVWVVPQLRSRR